MLDIKFNQFDTNTQEGMLLLASVAVLTGNIDMSKYGSNKSPDEVFKHIQDLANRIFFEEEYKQAELQKKRNKKLEQIINGTEKKRLCKKKI
jgi:hypothetical protein